jgi:ABC-2 type transport system permease protein
MRTLKALPTLLRVGFAEMLAYRAELLVWMLTTTMPLVSLALWSAVAAEAPIGRFGPGDFVAYFLSALVVRQVTGTWVVWEMNMAIRSGALSQRLLKPIHPLWGFGAEQIAAVPIRAVLCSPVIAVAISSGQVTRDPQLIAIFFASLVGAWFMNFFIMTLIGSLAFFLESSTSIFDFWMITFTLLSGYIVPLELFPGWVRTLADALPFRYTLGYPAEVAVGLLTPGEALRQLGVQWGYAALAALAAVLTFRAGVRRFEAFGS